MPNRLTQENSLPPTAADNPVDWYPWGDAAFKEAESLVPLIVSIGYSSCHWVNKYECFEDEYIASIMNKHFVCVKVDREERPDVDQIYMEAVQMIQQQGGWHECLCLPDGAPFLAELISRQTIVDKGSSHGLRFVCVYQIFADQG